MKKYLLLALVLLLQPFDAKSDLSIIEYVVSGIVLNEKNAPIANESFLVKQKYDCSSFTTDNEGRFLLTLSYMIPCTSGIGDYKTEKNVAYATKAFNGENLSLLHTNQKEGAVLPPLWKPYYLGEKAKGDTTQIEIQLSSSIDFSLESFAKCLPE